MAILLARCTYAVPGNLKDWKGFKGDRVEIYVEDGHVRILFKDEEPLNWLENLKSIGWMWWVVLRYGTKKAGAYLFLSFYVIY